MPLSCASRGHAVTTLSPRNSEAGPPLSLPARSLRAQALNAAEAQLEALSACCERITVALESSRESTARAFTLHYPLWCFALHHSPAWLLGCFAARPPH